jgi:hypothetical protein
MQCRPLMLILPLLALNPSSCTPEEIDSFCQVYQRVVLEKGDGKIVASDGVKRRLLANELFYKEQCHQS